MAPPLCGRRARGKPRCRPHAARAPGFRKPAGKWISGAADLPPLSSLSTGGFPFYSAIFRDSYWPWPRRSSGNGGKPSQPQPEWKIRPVAFGRQGGKEAKGRAADEAAARRKLRACPLADAKAAGFVKCPPESRRPSGTWGTKSEPRAFGLAEPVRRDTGLRSRTCPGGRRGFGQRLRGLRNRGNPGLRLMDPSGGTRASAMDPAGSELAGFGLRRRQGGKRDFGSESAERRTAGASAPSGSPRGNRNELRLLRTPEDAEPGLRSWFPHLETARRECTGLPGLV
jgi:hypothetical protein